MRLDDFIKENNESFNNEEPPTGHFERFERRLHRKPLVLRISFIAAAAVVAALAVGLIFFENNDKNNDIPNCLMSAEMRETRDYYKSVLDANTEHLENLLKNVNPDVRNEILSDLREITGETETFCNNTDDGIAAMLLYYNSKIAAIESISKIFENENNFNNNN